jgi:hypothetical protein
MRRRMFMVYSSFWTTTALWALKEPQVPLNGYDDLMFAIQTHIIPFRKEIAPTQRVTNFLIENIYDDNYDKEIRESILEGLKKFDTFTNSKFKTYDEKRKEQALRSFEENGGGYFLEKVLMLTLEAILSDPIYDANSKREYWKLLGFEGGLPRPKKRYYDV